jgi:phospholipase/carboxylesterase
MTNTNPLALAKLTRPPREAVSGRPPLLLLLHGYGSHQHDLFGLAPAIDPRLYIVSLRAPYTLTPGSYSWFGLNDAGESLTMDEREAAASVQLVAECIRSASREFDTDPARVYLMGFSQGAMVSAAVALENPGLVAGAIMMSGQLLPQTLRNARAEVGPGGLSMLITHGVHDTVIPVRQAREARVFLESLAVLLGYHEYDMAHQLTQDCFEDVSAWLTAQLD